MKQSFEVRKLRKSPLTSTDKGIIVSIPSEFLPDLGWTHGMYVKITRKDSTLIIEELK